jgi:uncharacterized membrane protein
LLLWLSLFPFVTAWMGENDFARGPVFAYGVVAFLAAAAYYVLQTVICRLDGPDSPLAEAIGRDLKGKISPGLYAAALPAAFVNRWISVGLYVTVALIWLIPDRRLERQMSNSV